MASLKKLECPRRGFVVLQAEREEILIETTCKTKGCYVCKDKVRNRFVMLVEYGLMSCSMDDRSYFITATFKTGSSPRDVHSVSAVWREMLVWLRSTYGKKCRWIKVVELTQWGQPHLHLILTIPFPGGISQPKAACQRKGHRYDSRWRSGLDRCECLEHRFAAAWYRISGDSFVVHVASVEGRRKAAKYLGKYIAKDLLYLAGLKKLGFKRSWSRSNSWPGERLMLLRSKQLGKDAWEKVTFWSRSAMRRLTRNDVLRALEYSGNHRWSERTGGDLAVLLAAEAEERGVQAEFEKWRSALDLQTRQYLRGGTGG